MNRFDTVVEYNIDGEDNLYPGLYINQIAKLTTMVWDKSTDGFQEDLTENDVKKFPEFLSFLENQGFVIPNKDELLMESDTKKLEYMKTIFNFLLNICPTFFSENVDVSDIHSLSEFVTDSGNKVLINFFKYQLPKVLVDFLTLSPEE